MDLWRRRWRRWGLSLEACAARRSQRIRDGIDIAGSQGDQSRQRKHTQRTEISEAQGKYLLHKVGNVPRPKRLQYR